MQPPASARGLVAHRGQDHKLDTWMYCVSSFMHVHGVYDEGLCHYVGKIVFVHRRKAVLSAGLRLHWSRIPPSYHVFLQVESLLYMDMAT